MSTVQHLEIREGWMWPKADDVAFDHIKMYLPLLRLAARQPQQRRVAVQAGGNAGVHPVELAKLYERVITFEPERLNYECLLENARDYSNVEAHQAVVGNRNKPVGIAAAQGLKNDKLCVNTGSFMVDGDGDIPQIRIDDLDLDQLDFLQLDVEGWELNALKGAEKTIERCSPVIMIERFEHGDDPEPFLIERGYNRIVKGVYDHVYVRQHGS